MRKTSLIVALATGLAGAMGLAGSASAQPGEPAAPTEPQEPPAAPAAPDAGDTLPPPAPPSAEEAPADAPPAAGAAPAPLEHTLFPNPSLDSENLKRQGEERPDARNRGGSVTLEDIFAEDWWSHARPIFEFHGYFRTRAHLFYNFALGRRDAPASSLYAPPPDNQYTTVVGNMPGNTVGPVLCRNDETEASAATQLTGTDLRACRNKTQAGANLRFRLNPELHVSDNVRVLSQIDILDNVVFGSTPEGYELSPALSGGGYQVSPRSPYLPNGYLDATQAPPRSGVNSLQDSISVKRAWAEFTTPLGEARFGRMPNHWGLGMVFNGGDGYDDDAQSTVDRIMFASGIKLIDLVVAGMWDFPHEGPTTGAPYAGSEQYDRAELDDVSQYGLMILRSKSPELTKLELARGNLVFNTGLYVSYRDQLLADDRSGNSGANVPGADAATLGNTGYARRGLSMWLPDLWLQLLYKKLRIETEIAAVLGSVESTAVNPNVPDFATGAQATRKLRQYGFAFELQQKLVEDRLRLSFKSGWASGDADAFDPDAAGNLIPGNNEQQVNDDTISTFRFHPSYRVDGILNRYILQRIQGTYYFNPSLDYDFSRQPNGQRIGGGISAVWTRASEFVQTPGHSADLGLELGGSLYFQSKDGAINDDPTRMGGFFGQLQYSVLFPLDGLGYQAVPRTQLGLDTSAAQMLRLYLGVMF
ncbi:MAG: TIGR04551 family protein [Deltaproteobacteria bacterium]